MQAPMTPNQQAVTRSSIEATGCQAFAVNRERVGRLIFPAGRPLREPKYLHDPHSFTRVRGQGGGLSGGLRSRYASARALCWLCRIASLSFILAAAAVASAEDAHEASTSNAARQDAIKAIPMAKVDAKYRRQVSEVLSDPSLFRRLPTSVVDCQPEMFTFLAQNPEVLTEIWRELGVSRVELTRTGENSFDLRDNAGTKGNVYIVEQTCDAAAQNRVVMYSEGSYDGKPFSKPVGARCVFLLRSGSIRETNGRQYVAARLDAFVKIDRATVEVMAQVAHPFVGKTADRNFADTLTFVSNLSYTAERRPDSIVDLSTKLSQVDEVRRVEFGKVARRCAADEAAWQVSQAQHTSAEVTTK
jgi:hypothetical protein